MSVELSKARLIDVADLNPSLVEVPTEDETVSFLPMSAVDAERVDAVDSETRPFAQVSKGYTPFLPNDVLVAKITPCFENGKIAHAKPTRRFGFGSTEFHVVRAHAGTLDPRYLVHFLRQKRIRLDGQRKMTGSAGQRRVPEHFLAELQIPLAPLHEQRRIAEILDKADALRAKRRAALAELDTLTRSIFLDMFGDPATNPKGWPEVSVGEYVAGFQGGRSMEAEADGPVATRNRVLKVSAVTGMQFRPSESKPLADSYSPPDGHFVRPGDLLFSRANTTDLVGAVAFVHETPSNLLLPDKLWRFVWRQPVRVEPLFVWMLFQSASMRYEIGRRATGTSGSMKNISQEKVLGIRSLVPPLELQRIFVRRFSAANALRELETAGLGSDDELFASLQHRAFRGDVSPGAASSQHDD